MVSYFIGIETDMGIDFLYCIQLSIRNGTRDYIPMYDSLRSVGLSGLILNSVLLSCNSSFYVIIHVIYNHVFTEGHTVSHIEVFIRFQIVIFGY